MAEWIRRLTTDQEIPGSSPGRVDKKIFLFGIVIVQLQL